MWFLTFSVFIVITLHPPRRLPTVYHQVSHSMLEFSSIRGFLDVVIDGPAQIAIRKLMFL